MRTKLQIDIALYDKRGHYGSEIGYFASPAYSNLGGVATFLAQCGDAAVTYSMVVYENPFALSQTKLPHSILSLCTVTQKS